MTLSSPGTPSMPNLSPMGYEIRAVEPEDTPALLELFSRAFPMEQQNGSAYAMAVWKWKYQSALQGNRFSVVAVHAESNRIVAHIGGVGYATQVYGKRRLSVQSVDNMADPDHRYRESGVPVFSHLIQRWWEDCVVARNSITAWGFPTQLNHRVGSRAAGYELVEHVDHMSRSAAAGSPGTASATCPVETTQHAPEGADALWERCRSEIALGLVRDHAYLEWRYGQYPGQPFRFLTCRDAGSNEVRGIAVLRKWTESNDVALLAEWLVPLEDREAQDALLAAAGKEADRMGTQTLVAWFPREHAWSARFREEGFWPKKTRRLFVARVVKEEFDIETMRANIFATPGDIDIN